MDTDVILMYKVANFLYTSGSTWIPIYLYPYAQIGFNVFGVYLYVNMDRDRCPFSPYVWNKKISVELSVMPNRTHLCHFLSFCCQFAPFTPFAHLSTINTRNYKIDNLKKHFYKLKLYRRKAVGKVLKSELTTTQEEEEL